VKNVKSLCQNGIFQRLHYREIIRHIVWNTVKNSLPKLIEKLEMLPELK